MGRSRFRSGASIVVAMKKLGKESPAVAIAGKVIEAEIHGNRAKPSACARILAQLRKTLEGLKEHFLDDVLGLGLTGEETHGRAKDHILVVAHEQFELLRVAH